MMSFDLFIKKGLVDFKFGENIANVIEKLDNYKLCPINENTGQFGIFYNGIELLFDDNKLYLVQYEFDRVHDLFFNGHHIQYNTTYTHFRAFLTEAKVSFSEKSEGTQKILITDNNVYIYFNQDDERFLTAMQSWF